MSNDAITNDFTTRVFLFGADMNPTAIRARWSEGRFLGIASVDGLLARGIGLAPYALGPRIWGILIETGAPQRGVWVPIEDRSGTEGTAVVPGDIAQEPISLEGMLAEARYWELPGAYRDLIEAAIVAG